MWKCNNNTNNSNNNKINCGGAEKFECKKKSAELSGSLAYMSNIKRRNVVGTHGRHLNSITFRHKVFFSVFDAAKTEIPAKFTSEWKSFVCCLFWPRDVNH